MSGMIGGGGAGIGGAMASVAFIVISRIFPGDSFDSVGWRVMFFTGLLGALLSIFVMRKVEESPMWEAAQAKAAAAGSATPTNRLGLRDLVTGRYRTILLINVAVAAGGGAQYYLTSGFLPTLLGSVMNVPAGPRGGILLVASLAVIIGACAAGELSEHLGRRRTMLIIGSFNIVCLPLLTWALVSVEPSSTGAVLLLAALLALLANASYAPILIFLNERYPTELRSRGTAISWNTGFMLGGLLPTFVSLLSPSVDDIASRLIVFIVGSVVVYLVAVAVSPETRGALDRHDVDIATEPMR